MTYASFWKRSAAYIIDGIIYGLISSVVGQIVALVIGLLLKMVESSGGTPTLTTAIVMLCSAIGIQITCYLLYFVWAESSSWQATIGKKIFGLRVVNLDGERISFWRSLGRNLGMIISSMILGIGYLMCLWTEKKQCLHDNLASCLVVDTKPNEKQGCAIWAIVGFFALLVVIFVGGILLAIAMPQYTQSLEKARANAVIAVMEQVRAEQQNYFTQNKRYATKWDQLTFAPCQHEKSSLCNLKDDFTLQLEYRGVGAQRKSQTLQYRLFKAYNSKDTQRNLVCTAQQENAAAFCEQLTGKPAMSRPQPAKAVKNDSPSEKI